MNAILNETREQILRDLVNNHVIELINPPGPEHRRDFINSMPTLLLFKERGSIGLATHYVLAEKWWHLSFAQLVLIRRKYEQTCY
jgi:hypothetical protein